MNPKPFVKWAGGKTYLLHDLHEILNKLDCNVGYCEPMVGGGALYWSIFDKFKRRIIADVNEDLINLYCIIRDVPEDISGDIKREKRQKRKMGRNKDIIR